MHSGKYEFQAKLRLLPSYYFSAKFDPVVGIHPIIIFDERDEKRQKTENCNEYDAIECIEKLRTFRECLFSIWLMLNECQVRKITESEIKSPMLRRRCGGGRL